MFGASSELASVMEFGFAETAKRRIMQTTPHTQGLKFSDTEDLDKTETGSPQRRHQMQVA